MMDNKKLSKNLKLDELANLKSLLTLNETILDAVKTAIRDKNNEMAFKMIDNIGDRPELWFEYLSIAIVHQNFPFFKNMMEKYRIDTKHIPNINASAIYADAILDPQSKSLTEKKEHYSQVDCPFIIQASIGGDLDIFKFLVDKGANLNSFGHITLSKRNRNSVISNILGAAAYYGRFELLHFILEKFPQVEKNYRCTEKKVKTKGVSQVYKEFSDFSPAMLTITAEISEDDSIQILKLLNKYGANLENLDWNKNTILHLAVKYNKFSIVKYIIEDLNLIHLNNKLNKEGQTPISMAKDQENFNIVKYLEANNNLENNNDIEKELEDIIASTKKKKNKKKQEKKENLLLNSTEFQETFKVPKPKPKLQSLLESNETHLNQNQELKSNSKQHSTKSDRSSNKSGGKNNEEDLKYNQNPLEKKSYERKSYYQNNYNNYNNKGKQGYNYNKYYYNNYPQGEGRYEDYEQYGNYNSNYNYGKYNESKNKQPLITKGKEEVVMTTSKSENNSNLINPNAKNSSNQPITTSLTGTKKHDIIGLNPKLAKKYNKKDKEKEPDSIDLKQTMENVISESTEKNEEKKVNKNLDMPEEVNTKTNEKPKIPEIEVDDYDEVEDFLEEDHVDNIDDKIRPENSKTDNQNAGDKQVVNQQNESQTVQIHTFVTSQESKNKVKENTPPNPEMDSKSVEIINKYLALEKLYQKEHQEKSQMELYFRAQQTKKSFDAFNVCSQISNSEENIVDLLSLANEELERKSKVIAELTSKLEYLEGKNLDNMNENQLNNLRNFYGARLSSIVAALNNLNNDNNI